MSNEIINKVEEARKTAQSDISERIKKLEEQYFTPPRVSSIMASMFSLQKARSLSVLDPCAGVGNLAAAVYQRGINNGENQLLTLIERDDYLYRKAFDNFFRLDNFSIRHADFFKISDSLQEFDRIILNPPYAKIRADSELAKLCKSKLQYLDNNVYSMFVSFCLTMLSPIGELVAIVPRSFCNGTLFAGFRNFVFKKFFINEIYSFESREVFQDSKISQEVIIIKLSRTESNSIPISHEMAGGRVERINAPVAHIVFPDDSMSVIHIPHAIGDEQLLSKISRFNNTLRAIGLRASTGKVVDFRCKKHLRKTSRNGSVRLIYQDCIRPYSPTDVNKAEGDLPRFISINKATEKLLIPRGNYILVRRISFKESPTRIVCSPLFSEDFVTEHVAIENHLNYIWSTTSTITRELCIALNAYLKTKTIDQYIRRFSGHTQINASDINSIPIPSIDELLEFYEENGLLPNKQMTENADDFFFASERFA